MSNITETNKRVKFISLQSYTLLYTTSSQVHKVLMLTADQRDQRRLQNSDKNKLIEIKVKLEAN